MTTHFTQDWFSANIGRFSRHLEKFKSKPDLNFLEIGSFEGKSTLWLLDNILTHGSSKIYCLDTFEGSYEHKDLNLNLSNLYDIFLNNVSPYGEKVKHIRGKSSESLLKREIREKQYDFIYIDGCHESKEVLEDAVLSWPLLKEEGIMIFDDYLWGDYRNNPVMTPKISVDGFISSYRKYINILAMEYQVVIQKIVKKGE